MWDEGFREWIGGKGIVDVMEDGLVGRRKIVELEDVCWSGVVMVSEYGCVGILGLGNVKVWVYWGLCVYEKRIGFWFGFVKKDGIEVKVNRVDLKSFGWSEGKDGMIEGRGGVGRNIKMVGMRVYDM